MSKETAMTILAGTETAPLPAEPAPAVTQPPVDLDSTRFAKLAKKEAEIVKKNKAADEQLAKLKIYNDKIEAWNKKKETNRVEALMDLTKDLGFEETDLVNWLAEGEKVEAPEEKYARIAKESAEKALANDRELQAKAVAEEKVKTDKLAVDNYRVSLVKYAEEHKEQYPWINYWGKNAQKEAYDSVIETLRLTKGEYMPTVDEVFSALELSYESRFEDMSTKVKGSKTAEEPKTPPVSNTTTRTRTVTTPAGSTPIAPAIQRTRTLDNSARATGGSATKPTNETPAQKKARLVQALIRGSLV